MKEKIEIPEHLLTFLKKERVLTKYKNNILKSINVGDSKTIINAFTWFNSPEGHDFWENIHFKYLDYLKENNIPDED